MIPVNPSTATFFDPIRQQLCTLVVPRGGAISPLAGQPKIGVAHPDCGELADLLVELNAFSCPSCGRSGWISGAWAALMIERCPR